IGRAANIKSSTIANSNDGLEKQNDLTRCLSSSSLAASVLAGESHRFPSPVGVTGKRRQIPSSAGPACRPYANSSSKSMIAPKTTFREYCQQLQPPDTARIGGARSDFVRRVQPFTMTSKNRPIHETRAEADRGRKDSAVVCDGQPSAATQKLRARTKSPRKWRLLGRSHSQPAAAKRDLPPPALTVAVAVTVADHPAQNKKPVAFYTLFDYSDQEDGGVEAGELLREACGLGTSGSPDSVHCKRRRSPERKAARAESPPTPEKQQPQQQQYPFRRQPGNNGAPYVRQKQRKLPLSQNVNPSLCQSVPMQAGVHVKGTTPSGPFQDITSRQVVADCIAKTASARTAQTSPKSFSRPFCRASLQFSPSCTPLLALSSTNPDTNALTTERNFCELAAADSTAGAIAHSRPLPSLSSTASSGLLSFAATTAVVPDPSAPLAEDEIWDEYDDLFGEQAAEVSSLAGSSAGVLLQHKVLPVNATTDLLVTTKVNQDRRETEERKETASSITKPFSLPSMNGLTRVSESRGFGNKDAVEDPTVVQVALRVSSMTVSRWLTFGQVLFSPARCVIAEAASPPHGHSVLIIDGLGNDDWSFYAAETYPAAAFFNLSPCAPLPLHRHCGTAAFPLSPRNHCQIQYSSYADRLPFASGRFRAVVFRFPAAARGSDYRNIVDEARRVLKPGGYLELSIMDLELNGMGPRTRRAIRQLKERMSSRIPESQLGAAADAILRFVGVAGFANVKCCRVGIPVSSSSPPRSDRDSIEPGCEARPVQDRCSLAEMMASGRPTANESISSTLARVGRWWHSQCYKDAAPTPTLRQSSGVAERSDIWTNRALLEECEEWQTTFRFTVCYARTPDVKA
ncbi:hypothetical protein SEPCBS119000_004740, partial [Sporothrix epigloea]